MAVRALHFMFPGIQNVGCLFQMRTPAYEDASEGTIVFRDNVDPKAVSQNRKDLLSLTGVSSFAEVHQVHGDKIVFEPSCSRVDEKTTLEADGLATQKSGLALMVKTADCQPLLLAHKSGKYIAALHVGWRGNRQLFPFTGVRSFCQTYNISPSDCVAVRGPSLGPARARFTHFGVEWGGYFAKYLDLATSTMDLWGMTRDQLVQAGIPERNIYGIDICTASNAASFFSYREDRGCGRQAALIWRLY